MVTVALLATLAPTPAFAAEPPGPTLDNYVALGDSYSSGEGLKPYLKGTNRGTNTCHRSKKGYPYLLAEKLPYPVVLTFRACSGARIANMTQQKSEPPQLNYLSDKTDLVTVSIGGNDADWAGTITDCLQIHDGDRTRPILVAADAARCDARLNGGPDLIAIITNHLYVTYKSIRRKAPNAKIRVVMYPPMFPDRGNATQPCKVAHKLFTFALSAERTRRMVTLQKQLNEETKLAVNRLRTDFRLGDIYPVDLTEAWGGYRNGHTINCGDKGRPSEWINPLSSAAWPTTPMRRNVKEWWLANAAEVIINSPSAFHPRAMGHQVMAEKVADSLVRSAPVTTPKPGEPLRSVLIKAATSAQPVPDGGVFHKRSLSIVYHSGKVLLSGAENEETGIVVDDVLDVTVKPPNGEENTLFHDFTVNCDPPKPTIIDLTKLLAPGTNRVTITLRDDCGTNVSNSDIYLQMEDARIAGG
jgi:lysophospholipase L1-like esterase